MTFTLQPAEQHIQRIDWIIRQKPYGDPYTAAKSILKAFGKTRSKPFVDIIADRLFRSQRPWQEAANIYYTVQIAPRKRK